MELPRPKTLNKTFLNFLTSQKIIKLFYTLNKTPLGETGFLSNIYYLSAAQVFIISFFVTYGTPCHARGHRSHLIFCDLWDIMPCQRSLLSSLTTFVTYGTPSQARGHYSHLPPNPYLGKHRISLEVTSILKISAHILSLLAKLAV